MRRALSIFLALFFVLGPFADAFDGGDDARLPVCCRRHGTHHCAMSDADLARGIAFASGAAPLFTAPSHCPLYPANVLGPASTLHALAASALRLTVPLPEEPFFVDSPFFPSSSTSLKRTDRGPPAFAFA